MSSRKRTLGTVPPRRQRRTLPPLLENLESRTLLSQLDYLPVAPVGSGTPLPNYIPPVERPGHGVPTYHVQMKGTPDGGGVPDQSTAPVGYTPQQIQDAYGVNLINFGAVPAQGQGITIAVIDVGDNPAFAPTGPKFVGSALQVFDATFGIPDPPSFKEFNQSGGTTLPSPAPGWGPEIALDIEWAHAIAPLANIEIVEADNSSLANELAAAKTAVTTLGASVVSMSFGGDLEFFGAGAFEAQLDKTDLLPALQANPNVTFLASTGDTGADPGDAPNYPSVSPLVVAVGGTTLTLTSSNLWANETGWSYGSDSLAPSGAGGGGISTQYPEPDFQSTAQNSGHREVPDVSSDADPNTGVAVFDPFDFGTATPWVPIGGTSVSSPTWAGFIAIADQGRALQGYGPLGGPTQTLPALYNIASSPATYAADFHDITVGNNHFPAGPGYDLITGLGSPITNNLIPDLVAFGQAAGAQIEFQPPSNVIAGGIFGTVVEVLDPAGNPAEGFTGTATISLVSGPAPFTPVSVSITNGIGVIDGLSLSTVSATPYNFQVKITTTSSTFATLPTTPVTVDQAATPGVGVFYPLPVDISLRNDIDIAGFTNDGTDNLFLVYPNTFNVSQQDIAIGNTTPGGINKSINIIGQGPANSVISGNSGTRVFFVGGPNSNLLSVTFQGLTIEGGLATDNGGLTLPSGTGVGGGLLIDGGAVALSNVKLTNNDAVGTTGTTGFQGASRTGGPGGRGGAGGNGEGGAIYMAAGSLTLNNDLITGNSAQGGLGGLGGSGGLGGTLTPFGFFYFPREVSGGPGGTGGVGGSGQGGGVFINGGKVFITGGSITGNNAVGGQGGDGGHGGQGGTVAFLGGHGGLGGAGGQGAGAGVYLFAGAITLNSTTIAGETAQGGVGGHGGTGGFGGEEVTTGGSTLTGVAGNGGDGGKGGPGSGGGMYVVNGTLNWANSTLESNQSVGGQGGLPGPAGIGVSGAVGGTGGPGGSGAGGGIFDDAALTLTGGLITGNVADVGGGIDIKGALTLNNSTVTSNSATTGGGININGALTVSGGTISDNSASSGGGINSTGNITVTGASLTGNSADLLGGAINSSGKVTVSNSSFANNSAQDGGAIFSAKNSTLNVSGGSSFSGNQAQDGGAIESQSTFSITNSSFTGNVVSGGTDLGGAIFNNQGKATINNVTFTNNSAGSGGAIDSLNGTLAISNGSTFTTNTATNGGGAINSSGTLTVAGGSFTGNIAKNGGGGAIANVGPLTVTNVSLTGNSAKKGGGGAIFNQGTLGVSNATITGNAALSGGGIFSEGNFQLLDSAVSNNSAAGTGGGVFESGGSVSASGVTIASNTAGAGGGGVFINSGALTVGSSTVSNNTAGGAGGGIENLTAALTLNTVTLSQNTAGGSGGGVYNNGGLNVAIVTFSDNSAANGGGLFNAAQASGTIIETTLDLNKASSGDGGGIENAGVLGLTNVTVAQNSAQQGGGLFNNGGVFSAVNATIAENSVTGGGHGGGIDSPSGSVTLFNTIVASNLKGLSTPDDIFPLVVGTISATSAFNLIGAGGIGVLTDGSNGNQVGVSATHLSTLGDNGGPLPTLALLTDSPAIDAGSSSIPGVTVPTFDERGAERGPGGINAGTSVDIGAYEASSSYLVTTTVDEIGYGTMRSAVEWANVSFNDNPANLANPAPNTVTFDTSGVFSAPRTVTLVGATLDFTNTSTPEEILGTGLTNFTMSGGNTTQLFHVGPNVNVTLAGMTITQGLAAAGGAVDNFGTLLLANDMVSNNVATSGGAVSNEGGATLSVVNSTIAQNVALSGSPATTISTGGAIANAGTLSVMNSTVSNNSAGNGGAIINSGQLSISGSTFANNSSTTGGGGGIMNSGTLSIVGSTFSGDTSMGGSGQGGAIANAGTLTITNGTFVNNSTSGVGGGIYNNSPVTAQIIDSTFSTNSALTGGGIESDSAAVLSGTTLSGNSASFGGGVGNMGTLTVTNSTLSGNSATTQGGGLFNQGALTLVNATIAYNNVADGGTGGGLDALAGTTILYNTIVALDTVGSGPTQAADDIDGTVSAASANNLVDDTNTSGGLASGTNGNLVGVLPGLAPSLTNNGGPTLTIALQAGSPAIDGGSSLLAGVPTIDERGALRGPAGLNAGSAVDIGAYEASSSYAVSTNADSIDIGTLRTAVGWANVSTNANPANILNPAPDTVIFSTTGTIDLTGGTLALANSGSTPVAKAIVGPGVNVLTVDGNNLGGVFSVAGGVTASMTGLTITGGLATGSGGGIDNTGALTLTNIAVTGNAADTGAGVANESGGTLTVSNSSFANNTATDSGGALSNSSNLLLSEVTFTGNSATTGAAIANLRGGSLNATESSWNSNSATGAGGAIDNAGTFKLTNSSLVGNTATSGGAIAQESTGALMVINSTLALNSAPTGGAVVSSGSMTLVNVTIADNVGVIANSAAAQGGGLDVAPGGLVALYNTIIAQNTTGTGALAPANDIAVAPGGAVSPASANNLIGTGGSGGLLGGGSTANQVGVANPGLAPAIAFSGGPTQTLALVAGSPAIDAGTSSIPGVVVPATDERGALRGPAGLDAGSTVDIGAYEATSSYLVNTTSDSSDVGTIATAVGWANVSTNANPANVGGLAPNTVVFDTTGVFSTPHAINLTAGTLNLANTTTPVAIAGAGSGLVTLSGGGAVGVLTVQPGVTATLTGLTITDGSAAFGGAINNSGNLTLNDDTLSGNTAGFGGALDNEATGTLTVANSTFSNNTATQGGGAVDNAGVKATLTNTTIANNSAPSGGGIYSTSPLTLVNDTIAYNNATVSGGGLDLTGGAVTLDNTIVALNTKGGTTASDISGTVAATGTHNIIDDAGSAGGLFNGLNNPNQVGIAAGLAAGLADNGGPTQTIALVSGSAALNTGFASISGVTVPTTDQRGAFRNPNKLNAGTTVDVGAYEASSSYLVTTPNDNTLSGTLRAAVAWANTNPATSALSGPNTILFDPNVFGTPQTITLSTDLGTLELTNTTTPELIQGPGSALLTIDGAGAVGLFSVESGVTATFAGMTIADGSAQSGGAILNQGKLTVANAVFTNDGAVFYGGAIDNLGGQLTVTGTTFKNNLATYGLGAAIDNSGTAVVSNSTFTGGVAFEGGAIDNKKGSLTVTDSTFDSNNGIQGGAIYNNASATITGSTFSNNSAFQGGAIANDLIATMTLLDSTIANNFAGQNGGGINQAGTLTAFSTTIADNVVASGGSGGGIDASSGTTTLYNTLVALNTAGTGTSATPSDVSGNLASASANNLIAALGTNGLTNNVNGNLIGVDKPNIGKLADNGGPTETIALLSGSPAIDAGAATFTISGGFITAPAIDQRGADRGAAGLNAGTAVDIGSYEASSSYKVTSSAGTLDVGTLPAAISWANANSNANPANLSKPAANTINFGNMPTITLQAGPLLLSNTKAVIAIIGPGANVLTVKGAGTSGVFSVASGVTASISGLTISGGAASAVPGVVGSGSGGAIDNSGNLQVWATALTGNTAIDGGAISNESGGTLTLAFSTLSGNSATTGGGIFNAGTLTALDDTIANNQASNAGAGVFNSGTVTAVSTTIAHNAVGAGGPGGGIDNAGGLVTFFDSIVAGNTASTTPSTFSDVAGTLSPASAFNLIGSAGSGGLENGTNSNLIVTDATAGLGNLASNGGPTQTIALLPGSAAIGSGTLGLPAATINVPGTDQRGGLRPTTGAIDIGALQSGATTFVPAIVAPIPVLPVTKASTTTTASAVQPIVASVTVPIVSPASVSVVKPAVVTVKKATKKAVVAKKAHPTGASAAKLHKAAHATKPKATKHNAVVKPVQHPAVVAKPKHTAAVKVSASHAHPKKK
jgi:fibronectin-binding autotransporter adhesin